MRADKYLVESGIVSGRDRAGRLIEDGKVRINGRLILRKSEEVVSGEIEVRDDCPFVGRGGLKLACALSHFDISVKDAIALDIGASTGGFTDCLLQSGARFVYAVDSGTNQLHLSLKNDPRVKSLEQTNARNLSPALIPQQVDICVMDVSFISQTVLHPVAARFLKENGFFISLIKPQFEVGKENVGKNGVVRKENLRLSAIQKVIASARTVGFAEKGVISSPITGGDGNVEYLACFIRTGAIPEIKRS